ncbi:MAG: hypothetical protein HY393_04045 [Candidatus Diapherotrites archaeon]|nr:hypothetical protein [Candidatus Diapherotrites archaeon]
MVAGRLFLVVACIGLFFSGFAFADIFMVNPVSQRVVSGTELDVGAIQPGQELELIISKDSFYGKASGWIQAFVVPESLPAGWVKKDSELRGETLIVRVLPPLNAPEQVYVFDVRVLSSSPGVGDERVRVSLGVRRDLLKAVMPELKKSTSVDAPAQFPLNIINNSVSRERVFISSNIPRSWFKPLEAELESNSLRELELEVSPKVHGVKDFVFTVQPASNPSVSHVFNATVEVHPTLKNKYSTSLYAFPFYTISILPYYLVNSFLSLLL